MPEETGTFLFVCRIVKRDFWDSFKTIFGAVIASNSSSENTFQRNFGDFSPSSCHISPTIAYHAPEYNLIPMFILGLIRNCCLQHRAVDRSDSPRCCWNTIGRRQPGVTYRCDVNAKRSRSLPIYLALCDKPPIPSSSYSALFEEARNGPF